MPFYSEINTRLWLTECYNFGMNMDCEVSLKSLLFVADGLEQLIGQHDAQAVLRSAPDGFRKDPRPCRELITEN